MTEDPYARLDEYVKAYAPTHTIDGLVFGTHDGTAPDGSLCGYLSGRTIYALVEGKPPRKIGWVHTARESELAWNPDCETYMGRIQLRR